MSTAEQFHVDEVSPSYWRVTFDNGPVNLLDPGGFPVHHPVGRDAARPARASSV